MKFKSLKDAYTLSNGVEIPCIGFGTWQADEEAARQSVLTALETGYRHIDTAQAYENEAGVGRAIGQSGIDRREIFLTTKLANPYRGYDETMRRFEESLERLQTDYLDLFLIHWPRPADFRDDWKEQNRETWRAFEDLYRAGRVRSIGISNFRPHHIDALLLHAVVKPMVNQIRLAPGDTQDDVAAYSRERDMLLEAYSPLGSGAIFSVPDVQKLAEKYNKTIAQIAIRWSLERGYLPLPKSVTPARIRENSQVFDFALEPGDVELLAGLTGCVGFSADPDAISW